MLLLKLEMRLEMKYHHDPGCYEYGKCTVWNISYYIWYEFNNEIIFYREFTMAEIEHFCDPNDKAHPKFASVADYKLTLYSACNQMDGKPAEILTIGEAVKSVIINSIFSLSCTRVLKVDMFQVVRFS